MATRKIEVNAFSVSSVANLRKQLEEYRKSLPHRIENFVSALLLEGYETAYATVADDQKPYGSHRMQEYITFSMKIEEEGNGVKGILRAIPTQVIQSKWYRSDESGQVEEVTGSINPVLAVEFGTAAFALPPQERFGGRGGQGTNSKGSKADSAYWYIATRVNEDGKLDGWKPASAIKPTRPLHNAMLAMENDIETLARRYF